MGGNAWLLLAVGNDRQHGGNDGYLDDPATTYRWDSTVPHHAEIQPGDVVVLWDKHASLGVSVIETIQVGESLKSLKKCPSCGMAGIKARKSKTPIYQCYKCKSVFDEPVAKQQEVVTYESTHDVGWVDLDGVIPASQLRSLCRDPRSQQSMRPLNWSAFRQAVIEAGSVVTLDAVESSKERVAGGHGSATVRVRIGQGKFRAALLEQFGSVCAFTGSSPDVALEAGHLYSYATAGAHHSEGGLLFRRDLHRMFDLGLICIDPNTQLVDVASALYRYPAYRQLHRRPLAVQLNSGHWRWLTAHWAQHRPASVRLP